RDPRSVESVTILKDAAAKALYGPLGAQGVFLVTTKKGHAGKTTVHAHANFGWEEPTTKAEMVGAYSYACLRNQSLRNDGLAERYTASELNAFRSGNGIDNDWRKLYMNDFRPVQNYNVEIAGGNERTKFYVNAGYSHTGSLYKADFKEKYNPEQYNQRFNLVSNIQVNMFSFLKMFAATNVRIGHTNTSRGNDDGDIIKSLYTTPPTIENGVVDGKVVADENFPNPIYGQINYRGVNKLTNTDVNASFGLDFDLGFITKGLTARAMVGYNSDYSGTRVGKYDYSRWVRDENGTLVRFGTANNDPLSWEKRAEMFYFMNFQAMVRWQRELGNHSFDALVSYLGEDRLGSSTEAAWLLPYTRIQLGGHV
ncbi:MAG: SusC/RagA family TonB-linked outer membrane protein, partial [Muribaculaceae bacterium]|nr:SusC/RagA family TonB-linked outer membrane protein [Muribaculaceae bacterium]